MEEHVSKVIRKSVAGILESVLNVYHNVSPNEFEECLKGMIAKIKETGSPSSALDSLQDPR